MQISKCHDGGRQSGGVGVPRQAVFVSFDLKLGPSVQEEPPEPTGHKYFPYPGLQRTGSYYNSRGSL